MSGNPYSDSGDPFRPRPAGEIGNDLLVGDDGEVQLPPDQQRGWVGHIRPLGWLMVATGTIELLFAGLLLFLGMVLPDVLAEQAETNPVIREQGLTAEELTFLVRVIYGGMGAGLLIVSILALLTGSRILQYRSRVFCLTGVAIQLFTLMAGCYCFPLGLVVATYGLVVLLSQPVASAFQFRNLGATPKQIREAFQRLPSN